MSDTYFDYRFKFSTANQAKALGALAALRAVGILPADGVPDNMLGDPITDASGTVLIYGRAGRAAMPWSDEPSGTSGTVPAAGDPAYTYVHIRTEVSPESLPAGFDPTVYGLETTTVDESAAVLGIYAA